MATQAMVDQRAEFHVQAGAFKIRENANVLIQQLHSRGYTGALVESADGPPLRVWVDGDLDRSAAEHLISSLHASGFQAILIPARTSLVVEHR